MPKRLVVNIQYWPSQPQAPCYLEIEETRSKSPVTIKHDGDKQDPVFEITVRPDINKEADEGLKRLLQVLEPENGSLAHEGLCLILEQVFFAALEFAKKHPEQVNT